MAGIRWFLAGPEMGVGWEMEDRFARRINYLRISITDRCNLRCVYCMPEAGIKLQSHDEILRLEEIVRLVKIAAAQGVTKVRLTGGEPLIRKGVVTLVEGIAGVDGIDDIALTTNGVLLPRLAPQLKKAGLNRVNISLDTLNPHRYRQITRVGSFQDAWAGIETALDVGFHPVKLNVVVIRHFNDQEILSFLRLVYEYPLHVRFIELMPIGSSSRWAADSLVPYAEIKNLLEKQARLIPAQTVSGSGPARYYTLPGAKGTVGFISPMSSHFCGQCNRIRLTADGKLRPCLHGSHEIDLRAPLRQGVADSELEKLFQDAVRCKPEKHTLCETGWEDRERVMVQIGG